MNWNRSVADLSEISPNRFLSNTKHTVVGVEGFGHTGVSCLFVRKFECSRIKKQSNAK